jgi:carboxyl-terminal processing protease
MQELSGKTRYYGRSILIGAVLGIGLALVFAAGFFFRGFVELPTAAAAATTSTGNYPLLDEVQNLLNRFYLRTQPNEKEREYAAIRGLLGSLNDKFTFFIDPPVAKSESDVLAGTYGGIGVQIQRSEKGDFILLPFPDSPALKAGVEVGDILRAVNKTPLDADIQADVLDQQLRGEVKAGSGVEITVLKPKTQKELTVFIPFAVINVPSVVWRTLDENSAIGYIKVMRFTSRTPEELKTGIQELQKSSVKGLILDLRDNSGGLLQESVTSAGQFLKGGIIVYEKSNQDERALNASTDGLATDIPLIVLVNKGTASAAELVAGAIQDRQRGILIGQTTYGKGTVQQIFRLSDNSSLHVTSAEWFTPNHHEIDGKGLQPDIPMIPDPNGRDVETGEAVRQLEKVLQGQGAL